MNRGLLRVLHVRRLLEALAGLDLQTRTSELRRLEGRAKEHGKMAVEARRDALQRLLGEAVTDAWLGMADADIFSWKRKRLESAAQKVSEEVAVVRERSTSRRIERQQVETLLAEAAQSEEQERNRREQQRVDDWFQSLPSSESRRSE